ncbi:MAG: acyl-CoA synthetase [Microbacterium sp.]
MSATARTFRVRDVQLVRALFAAVAAAMITFSSDHSAAVGLAVFSGFALTTALVLALAAWLVLPAGRRWSYVLLAVCGVLAGMAGGVPAWRNDDLFFAVVIAWALATGAVELIAGLADRRAGESGARDSITVGAFGILLAVALLAIPAGFTQHYQVKNAGEFLLTGIILGVGMLGGYAAIVAVFLGIAGLTPKHAGLAPKQTDAVSDDAPEHGPAYTALGGER